jgi:hypothetical protein
VLSICVTFRLPFLICFSYVLGAVETFLKAVPAAGMFKGKDSEFSAGIIYNW